METLRSLIHSDKDGVPDLIDDFPIDSAASLDTDGDGRPDSWVTGYSSLDSAWNLSIDIFPSDPLEWADTDSDGVGDNADFPLDASESLDTDGDGIGNNADTDDDGDGILDDGFQRPSLTYTVQPWPVRHY